MALYLRVHGCSNMNFYGGGFWTFFNNNNGCGGNCQSVGAYIDDTTGLYYFGVNSHLVTNLVVNNGQDLVTNAYNPGGWGSAVAAFLTDD